MKPSNDLFDLIKSLTKTEKTYVKKYSGLHVKGDSNVYMDLFDAIDKQEEYNEEKLKKGLENKKLVKRLSKEKNYLYKFILKALRSYYSSHSVNNQLLNYLIDIEILHAKGLFPQEQKQIDIAKGLAKDYDNLLQLLLILETEDKMKTHGVNLHTGDKDFLKLNIGEIIDIFDQYKTILKYRSLIYKLMEIDMKEGFILSNSEVLGELEKIKNLAEEDDAKDVKAVEAMRNRMIIFSYYHGSKGNYKDSYKYRKKLLELIESRPDKLKQQMGKYISAINNLFYYCMYLNYYDEAEELIVKLKGTVDLCRQKISLTTKVTELYYNAEMEMAMRKKNYSRGYELVPEIEQFLKERHDKISSTQELILYFNLSRLFINSERYEDALPWLNNIINKQSSIMINVQSMARILNIIVHYELGNYKLLDSLFRSTYRFLKNRKELFAVEKVILNYIRYKIPVIKTQEEVTASFINLKAELEELLSKEDRIRNPDYFDFVGWLDKKINVTEIKTGA